MFGWTIDNINWLNLEETNRATSLAVWLSGLIRRNTREKNPLSHLISQKPIYNIAVYLSKSTYMFG